MIPTVEDVKSDPLIHKFGELSNPPGITNFWGCVQVNFDITGIRSLNFPPFGISDTVTAGLFINDSYFPAAGCPITFIWYPDRIERLADYDGLRLKTITTLAVKRMAVLQEFIVENRSGRDRLIKLRLGFNGTVTKSLEKWAHFMPPSEADNALEIDRSRNAILFSARHSAAHFLQGTLPVADKLTVNGPSYSIKLKTGANWKLHYVGALAEKKKDARGLFDAMIHQVPQEIEKSRIYWNEELQCLFAPDNERYSGNLPVLYTTDKDILRIYHTGILSVISYKRDNPFSIYGRAYDTLMPRYWQTVTFIWDYSLSSLLHALLDPVVMKKYMQQWMLMDIHHHFGTDYLRGDPVGPWYSVNDHAMCGLMYDYLRWSGDLKWLNTVPTDLTGRKKTEMPVIEYLDRFAQSWRFFKSEKGLADYGGINNLLECVSTYIHEVASLNAANIFNMRFAAEVFDLYGDKTKSQSYLYDVAQLLIEVQKLYVTGKGFWYARHPGNNLVEVRHCYDFITVLKTIADDLSSEQKEEMTEFFRRELQTKTWMRALSASDDNAMFSIRPDHQWNGAYPAWPAQSVSGLYRIGKGDVAFEWLKGLAQSANQGPFGQAHFVESAVTPEHGGALKSPPDFPYMCDWSVAGNGCWANIIIESIFGVKATLKNGLSAQPQFGVFDPEAELHNLSYQGKQYKVNRHGIIK